MAKNVFAGVGIARGDAKDSAEVGAKAVELAVQNMKRQGGKLPGSFGLLFCSIKYDLKKLVEAAHKAFGGTPWVGCTTAGEISNYGFSQGSCVAMIVSSDYIHAGTGIGKDVENKPENAGKSAVSQALKKLKIDKEIDAYVTYLATKKRVIDELIKINPYYVLMLPQGPLTKSKKYGQEGLIMKGISSVVGKFVPILGGAAGDDLNMVQSFQFIDGEVHKDSVVTLFLATDVHIGISLEHGYEPTEKFFLVTKADGRLIQELNHKPALEEYCRAIGVKPEEFKKQPLIYCGKWILGVPDGTGNYWSVVAGGVVGNSLHAGATIQKNTMLCLLKSNDKKVLEAAKDSVENAIKDANGKDIVATIVFDCCIRWMNLREKVGTEINMLQKSIGKDKPLIGFYTYGEQGARYGGAYCGHFNASTSSMVITDDLFSKSGEK
ncbi:hypothetical protein A3K63_04840 [Candidatus Micrarchaeota archaeon RBG_16_49_10]|nr:MAG: hypothetical protein A3K63_04840 [Candidatus Micrarchaeota archaeon RBG_16_49_10]